MKQYLIPFEQLDLKIVSKSHVWTNSSDVFTIYQGLGKSSWKIFPSLATHTTIANSIPDFDKKIEYVNKKEAACNKLFSTRQEAVESFKLFILEYIPLDVYTAIDWKLIRKSGRMYSVFYEDKELINKFIIGKQGDWRSQDVESFFHLLDKEHITQEYICKYKTRFQALQAYYKFVEIHLPILLIDLVKKDKAWQEKDFWWKNLISPQYCLEDLLLET